MNETKQVLIVDDHAMVRGGLRLVIEAQPDLSVVGEAGGVSEAIEVATATTPDVITLDISMPGTSGVASIEQLLAVSPSSRIVVVTMHDDPTYVRSALAMGASGFVTKGAADSELVAAIRAVTQGRVFIDAGLEEPADAARTESQPEDGSSPFARLSEREREVFIAVAGGFANRQIAGRLDLSVKTVESYRARLMTKLGLHDRADLVRLALELDLLNSAGSSD